MNEPFGPMADVLSVPSIASPATEITPEIYSDVDGVPLPRQSMSWAERAEIETAAYLHGGASESYDIANRNGYVLKTPCGEGYLNLLPDQKFWHIPGSIISDEQARRSTVRWLKRVANERKKTIAVYSVSAEDVSLFHEAGFAVNKFGEEAVIDLGKVDWRGSCFEWVRRQTSFCRRHGLSVAEIVSAEEQSSLAAELAEVFSEDLGGRVYSRPLKLLEGEFEPRMLGRRRLFVARREGSDRIEGFLIANPMDNGTAWSFETYRKRSDSTRGTIPFLFREVIDRLQSEGARRVSLCLIPGKGVESDSSITADRRVRWLLELWYGRLQFLFNVSGQDYFKSRFRPHYQDRYICVYPRNSWCSVLSFLRTSGALCPNYGNILRKLTGSVFRLFK